MKQTTKTSRTAGYLEKIFRELNKDSFANELEEPIITIQSTPGAYGHVTVSKIWKAKETERYELNIAADWLERPIENIVATMLHEMTHLLNLQRGIQDCSRGGMYHNQKFRDEAEKHMISIAKHEKYGWTITSPTDELLEYIINKGWDDIDMGRGDLWAKFGIDDKGDSGSPKKPTAGLSGGETKRTGSRRYQCPKCKAIVRATKEVHITCKDCNVDFELT